MRERAHNNANTAPDILQAARHGESQSFSFSLKVSNEGSPYINHPRTCRNPTERKPARHDSDSASE